MKLLSEPLFEGKNKLLLNEGVRVDYYTFFNEIREVTSYLFTLYDDLIVKGEKKIEKIIESELGIIQGQYRKNKFIQNIYISNINEHRFYLGSNHNDISINNIKDLIKKEDEESFNAINYGFSTSQYVNGGMVDPDMPEPTDRWYFSSSRELEEGFISKYTKLKELSIEKTENDNKLDFFDKFNFNYSNHTGTYLKTIYIDGDFNGKNIKGINFEAIEDFFEGLLFGGKIFNLVKISKDILDYPIKVKELYVISLLNSEDIKLLLLDNKILALSTTLESPIDGLYDFLRHSYYETKNLLISDTKNCISNILLNFSGHESNIINQYNYLASNIGFFDFGKKSFLENFIKKYSNDFTKGGSDNLDGVNDTGKYNLTSLGVGDKKTEFNLNSIPYFELYNWITTGNIDFNEVEDNELVKNIKNLSTVKLSEYITDIDVKRVNEGKIINWKHYWFKDWTMFLDGIDFIKGDDSKKGMFYEGKNISFDILRVYQNDDNYIYSEKLNENLKIILKEFYKIGIKANLEGKKEELSILEYHLSSIAGIGQIGISSTNGEYDLIKSIFEDAYNEVTGEKINLLNEKDEDITG